MVVKVYISGISGNKEVSAPKEKSRTVPSSGRFLQMSVVSRPNGNFPPFPLVYSRGTMEKATTCRFATFIRTFKDLADHTCSFFRQRCRLKASFGIGQQALCFCAFVNHAPLTLQTD
jgi:hypothetical protein